MGMGFDPTWLRQVSPPPASLNHFNHCDYGICFIVTSLRDQRPWLSLISTECHCSYLLQEGYGFTLFVCLLAGLRKKIYSAADCRAKFSKCIPKVGHVEGPQLVIPRGSLLWTGYWKYNRFQVSSKSINSENLV